MPEKYKELEPSDSFVQLQREPTKGDDSSPRGMSRLLPSTAPTRTLFVHVEAPESAPSDEMDAHAHNEALPTVGRGKHPLEKFSSCNYCGLLVFFSFFLF